MFWYLSCMKMSRVSRGEILSLTSRSSFPVISWPKRLGVIRKNENLSTLQVKNKYYKYANSLLSWAVMRGLCSQVVENGWVEI